MHDATMQSKETSMRLGYLRDHLHNSNNVVREKKRKENKIKTSF